MNERLLILGRAGSGKTRRLLDRLAADLRAGAGRRTLLLVPTLSQASHLKRILLSRHPELPGFFDENIVTFTSLAERLLPDRPIREIVSGRRQDLLLRAALATDPPAPFAPLVRYPGFRRAALSFLKELKQNGRPAEELADRLFEAAESRRGPARDRLAAFHALFLAYERERRARGLVDHEDYLREARDALAAGAAPPLDYVGVDGFQNFTTLERELVLLLAKGAGRAEVTLPLDPALVAEGGRQFAVAIETREFFLARGFAEEVLAGNHRAKRDGLARLERHLFDPDAAPGPSDGSVEFLVGMNDADEADRIARRILRLVLDEGRGWRDVVVVVREPEIRKDLFREAFRRHGIPLRIYAEEDLSGHSLPRAVRRLLDFAESPSAETALPLLRTGRLPGVAPPAVDRLEHDFAEGPPPAHLPDLLDRVTKRSRAAAEHLQTAAAAFAGEAAEPRPAADSVRAVLDLAAQVLGPIPDPEGDPERVRREALAAAAIHAAADDLASMLGDLPPAEFRAALRDELARLSGRPRDRRLHAVNLIGAREARQWEAPVVFAAGLLEGEFPRSPREDVFLGDSDRRDVNDRGDLNLRERALERDEERYLFYVALTRAREKLVLSWPGADGKGEPTLPSLFLESARALFEDDLVSRRTLSEALPREDETADREDLRRRALFGLSLPYRPGGPEEERAAVAAALHDVLAGAAGDPPDEPYRRALRLGWRFRDPPAGRLLRPDRLALLRPAGAAHSPSSLTDFARCPYLHFAHRTLRLKPGPDAGADGLDRRLLGEVGHEVLRRLFAPMVEGGAAPDPAEAGPVFDEVFAERAAAAPRTLSDDRAVRDYRRAVARLVAEEVDRIRTCGFRPVALEAEFRLSFPAPEGAVAIHGRLDRLDAGPDGVAMVLDYKSTIRLTDGRTRILDGVSLELPLYLHAAEQHFGRRPAGAWLLSIRPQPPVRVGTAGAGVPDRTAMSPQDFAAWLDAMRQRAIDLDRRIRAAEIAIRPADPDVDCAWCDYADLCRFEPWTAAAGESGERAGGDA